VEPVKWGKEFAAFVVAHLLFELLLVVLLALGAAVSSFLAGLSPVAQGIIITVVIVWVLSNLSFAQIGSQFESAATTTCSIHSGDATKYRKRHWLS